MSASWSWSLSGISRRRLVTLETSAKRWRHRRADQLAHAFRLPRSIKVGGRRSLCVVGASEDYLQQTHWAVGTGRLGASRNCRWADAARGPGVGKTALIRDFVSTHVATREVSPKGPRHGWRAIRAALGVRLVASPAASPGAARPGTGTPRGALTVPFGDEEGAPVDPFLVDMATLSR
jgi:hypothetical protein